MARTRKLVVGNWKMYIDSTAKAKDVMGKVSRTTSRLKRTDVIVCPPNPFLGLFSGRSVSRGGLCLGAQDVSEDIEAPRTGESSVYMLKSLGAGHVIVGHSERRAKGETNTLVAQKIARVLKAGLSPILCIGESERDMHGEYLAFLESELRESLAAVPKAKAKQIIVAYEPMWAIGKSAEDAVTPQILHETALFIKKILVSMYGRALGSAVKILYGGSVEASNAGALVVGGTVDGLLVGHASTDAEEFSLILKSVDGN
ncbi:MAG: triosephosphate isomerase [Candidatus Pacebacteria bacterium]|nr:triosephosphate isomerase [Candidatus Paceibacterota bacterium]